MKTTLLIAMAFVWATSLGQTEVSNKYDFWIGNWEVSWSEGDGKIGKGTNRIEATLNGKVLQEHFQVAAGQMAGFKGTSISVFNPKNSSWKQAWADSNGGYFDFTGGVDDSGNPTFITAVNKTEQGELVQRMVFREIDQNAFVWDWEGSQDGGKTWKLNWQINYKRILSERSTGNESAFDPLLGTCLCSSERRNPAGDWQPDQDLIWTWEEIMNGKGIQDKFQLADGNTGGSIRQYNEGADKWYVHYYASGAPTPTLKAWEGGLNDAGEIVLYSAQQLPSGEHGFIKLTFFNISDAGYEWKGEMVNKDESLVQPFWRITCKR
ncbi:MAG: hypothetical protein KTR13_05740 [Saprospiraceae bacterium]|nr:hypothetical protein [Saprospiraceae bacterium]